MVGVGVGSTTCWCKQWHMGVLTEGSVVMEWANRGYRQKEEREGAYSHFTVPVCTSGGFLL